MDSTKFIFLYGYFIKKKTGFPIPKEIFWSADAKILQNIYCEHTHPQYIYYQKKYFGLLVITEVHILNFQRDLFVIWFIHIEIIVSPIWINKKTTKSR